MIAQVQDPLRFLRKRVKYKGEDGTVKTGRVIGLDPQPYRHTPGDWLIIVQDKRPVCSSVDYALANTVEEL